MSNVTNDGRGFTDGHSAGEHMVLDDFSRYLEASGTQNQTTALERHLLICRQCRHDLATAAKRRNTDARKRLVRRVAPLAAAAVLVVGGTTVILRQGGPADPVLRGPQVTNASTFAALAPVDGAVAPADSVVFVWRAAEPDAHYILTLMDESGDVVWSTEPADTAVALPPGVGLESGRYYYWFVDALLDGARSATTGSQEFVAR